MALNNDLKKYSSWLPRRQAKVKPRCLLIDNPNPAKPESFCNRGTYASPAIQKRTEIGTIDTMALRERSLTSLAFNCRSHRISNVIIIKHQEIVRFIGFAHNGSCTY